MNHAIIFTGLTDGILSRLSGAKKISNVCEKAGWNVDVIDFFVEMSSLEREHLLDTLVNKHTRWIGISYTFLIKKHEMVNKFVEYIRQNHPHLKIILGGSSNFYDFIDADWFVNGFAENAILKILDYEFGNSPPPMYTKHHNGKFVSATKNYPSAQASDYSVSYDHSDFLNERDVLTIELSRGCRFRCAYCTYPFLGIKEDTTATEESIYRELNENYQKWGIKNYIIADDTINDRTSKLVKLKNVINRLDFKPLFAGYIRADLLHSHNEQIELIAECNIAGHYYGIETFNHESGKSIGKGLHPERQQQTLIEATNYFETHMDIFTASMGMVIGLPYETEETIMKTVEWLNQYWLNYQVTPYPLMIPKSDSEFMSVMGINLKEYGYEHIVDHHVKNINILDDDLIFWKSPWMNSYKALILRQQVRDNFKGKISFGAFSLPSVVSILGTSVNKQRLDIDTFKKYKQQHINEYILSKLNSA